jgi:hypothetical protein
LIVKLKGEYVIMNNTNKKDMSATCGFKDAEMVYKYHNGKIDKEEFDEYWYNNCYQCIYMVEICMCGEE